MALPNNQNITTHNNKLNSKPSSHVLPYPSDIIRAPLVLSLQNAASTLIVPTPRPDHDINYPCFRKVEIGHHSLPFRILFQ